MGPTRHRWQRMARRWRLILKLSKNEYIVAGSGIVLEFTKASEKPGSEIRKQLGEDGFALSNEQIKTKKKGFKECVAASVMWMK